MIDSPASEILKRDPDTNAFAHRYVGDVSQARKREFLSFSLTTWNALVWIWNG
jgi:hypothetical protein